MEQGRLATFTAVDEPFVITRREPPEPGPGAVLVRITTANICGSDLHAWHGHFALKGLGGKMPTVLGHEMIGRVAALGEGVTHDSNGQPLAEGDRVTYTYFQVCGRCPACLRGHGNVCHQVGMAMLGSAEEWPYFVGGYADYYYVPPGAAIYRVPEEIPDELAAGANCALSQVIHGLARAQVGFGESVVIQGAGGLGIYAAAVAKAMGAARVVVIDALAERLDLARRFGADATVDLTELPDERARAKAVRRLVGGRGADVVVELVGRPEVIPEGVKLAGPMGRYVLIGNINYGLTCELDPSRLVMANKTVIGVSLYPPYVLGQALDFIARNRERLPFAALLSSRFPLEDINRAFALADRREVARASIVMAP